MIEFRVVEDMRFQQYGRGDIEPAADFREIGKELRISKFLFAFVNGLFDDMVVFQNFCPNPKNTRIIQKFTRKSKCV